VRAHRAANASIRAGEPLGERPARTLLRLAAPTPALAPLFNGALAWRRGELRVQRGTRIIELLVVLRFRSSHLNVPRVHANFGIGPLAAERRRSRVGSSRPARPGAGRAPGRAVARRGPDHSHAAAGRPV